MLRVRIIPTLLLFETGLVKTVKFLKHQYVGDPVNTCRIFNEFEVDELCFLDIMASIRKKLPDYELLKEISSECFMPVSYGGGIDSVKKAEQIFKIGFEKVVLNTATFTNPQLITEIASIFGSQSVVVAVDVKKNLWGRYEVYGRHGTINYKKNPSDWVKEVESLGAGEILLTNIDKEGTWKGFDIELIKSVTSCTSLPLIAHGGAGRIEDIQFAVKQGKASAVALGSMVVYQQRGMGVLINFPQRATIESILN